jgi:2-polyprenyl-6-methoxyphenol hydroxylase-like FAD-dependent oxidoreductase
MTNPQPLHVLIAGAGLSGLALAQGLTKRGHTVDVFERDADLDRKQGYYLHFNAIGGEALREVLPEDLFELYLETSRCTYERTRSIVLDPQLNEISSQPHLGPPNPGPRPHTGVHRRLLRQILSSRIGDRLHLASPVTSYQEDADGVTVQCADGSTMRGDLLVGADGIRSAVRTKRLPDVPMIPARIDGIGIFGRAPLTPELDAILPDIVNQGVLMAVDRKGSRLLIGSFRPRRPADEAASDIAPDVALDRVEPYAMISCSVPPGTPIPPPQEWTLDTAVRLRDAMLQAIEGWHPAAQALVAGIDQASMFAIPFGYIEPAEHWEPSRVTVVGDAAHGMLPTLGMGANLALNDAALLVRQLERYDRAEIDLVEAIGAYEAQMREAAYPIHRMTLDHDKNFGGGGLQDPGHQPDAT